VRLLAVALFQYMYIISCSRGQNAFGEYC